MSDCVKSSRISMCLKQKRRKFDCSVVFHHRNGQVYQLSPIEFTYKMMFRLVNY